MADKMRGLLEALSPAQQAFAQDYARLKLEAKMAKEALSVSEKSYAHLFGFMCAVLRQMPGYEIRFKRIDLDAYNLFKENYEMVSEYDEESGEQILKMRVRG